MASCKIYKGKGNPDDVPDPLKTADWLPDKAIAEKIHPWLDESCDHLKEGYHVLLIVTLSPKYCLYPDDKKKLEKLIKKNKSPKFSEVCGRKKDEIIAWTEKDCRLRVWFTGAHAMKEPKGLDDDSVEIIKDLTQKQLGLGAMKAPPVL